MKTNMLVKSHACSACGACLAVCPKQAISMAPDNTGCLYPGIDENRCIDCGACLRVCGKEKGRAPLAAYAAVGLSDPLVRSSASGGIFATLAQSCIASGGVAAGAVMEWKDDNVAVFHLLSETAADIRRMQGSKYVQSEAWRCYEAVKQTLKRGKTVLFSGTPCQVAAVKRLTGDPDNLITIDLICHGVPPVQMLAEYARILEARFRGRLRGLCFRDKSCGKSFCARIDMEHGSKMRSYYLQSRFLSFYKLFLNGSIYRENCYSCPYANMDRVSDMTIGDYWGVGQAHAAQLQSGEMEQRRDWSCVLVNTEKGRWFLREHGADLKLIPSRAEWIARENRQLNAPMQKPAERAQIMEAYQKGGYRPVEKVYIQKNGGTVRFFWRMLKNLHRNAKNATGRPGI